MTKARDYAGIRREDFRELVLSGEIPSSFALNGRRRIDTADIDEWYRKRRFFGLRRWNSGAEQ